MALLEVDDLVVRFRTHDGTVYAVNGVSFQVDEGETLGLVGESGCGKSVTSLALMRLLPKPAGRVEGGHVRLDGTELLDLSEAEMRDLRGRELAMIFQDPMTSLNPVLTIQEQMVETIRAHTQLTAEQATARAVELLGTVGIPRPETRLKAFPHEFSGGMRQRVMIAMALALHPRLLIADEPTTALDVTIQAQVLELLRDLTAESGTAVILITHDLGVVAGMTRRINVMYAGYIVETAPTARALRPPLAPVHRGPAALDPAPRRAGRGAAHPDRGHAARPAPRAGGLPLRAALRLAPADLLDDQPAARAARAGHAGRAHRRPRHPPRGLPESRHRGRGGGRPAAARRLRGRAGAGLGRRRAGDRRGPGMTAPQLARVWRPRARRVRSCAWRTSRSTSPSPRA